MGKSRTSSTHVELERKFDVPDDAVTPSFHGLAAIARVETVKIQSLEAVYYDTPGHDLSARKVTLRRRTGGSDAGWHVKLPGNAVHPEARTEVQSPLQPDVPDELRDVVLAIIRDRPLLPVARINNTREVTALIGTDDAVAAEFCDDRVSACRLGPDGSAVDEQTWREWELEVTDTGATDAGALLNRLTNRVLDAGGVPSDHGSKLAKTLGDTAPSPAADLSDPVHQAVAEQIERLLVCDRAVREDAPDSVHQMRVTTRQIRSLLQASGDDFGLSEDAWILGELRELAAVLGIARDAEVLAERYREALAALPPGLVRGPVAERLVEGTQRRYQAGLRRSLGAMRSARYFRLLDALEQVSATPPPPPDSGVEHTTIASSYRKVRKTVKAARRADKVAVAARAADADNAGELAIERDHALHRIRKAAKRLRYVAEATGDTAVGKQSKLIQTLLGEHQDSVVSREHLLAESEAAHAAGEDTFTYGVLYQREADLALRCEEQLPAALKALRRSVRKAR
ncbi:MAG: CYTH and CHAD domain-containing protein [Mycobacterium sp.]|nr:MAG: CYTH and CHAD domain-containing protein [Mycobacterium sp.]HPZ93712.1 CYTH and CHAD domain-containing protein [Mycobacterium sp.]